MFNSEYGDASVEVLDILDNTNEEDVDKIPVSFINFLVNIASDDYEVKLDHSKSIRELNISEKAKEILEYIYINWWSDDNQREQYKKQIEEQEKNRQKELREKYNPNNMFKNKKNIQISYEIQKDLNLENLSLEKVEKKENIFKRFISKIIFKK